MSNGTAINFDNQSGFFNKSKNKIDKRKIKRNKDICNSEVVRQRALERILKIEADERAGLVQYGTLEDLDAAMSRAIQRARDKKG